MSVMQRFRMPFAALAVIGLLALGYMATTAWLGDASAEEEQRAIPIEASISASGSSNFIKDGMSCSMSLKFPRFVLANQQIVIRNEHNTIVALFTLSGGEWAYDEELDQFDCNIEADIPVPDADFYTVYLGEERVVAYSADELPIDEFDRILINVDD